MLKPDAGYTPGLKCVPDFADERVMSHRCQNCKRVVRKPEAIKACQCPYCNDRWAQSEPPKATPGLKAANPSKA